MNLKKMLPYILVSLLACKSQEPIIEEEVVSTEEPSITTKTLISGYEVIWGMDFLPNGQLVFSEKKGNLYLYDGQKVSAITGLPTIHSGGQGGLLDIRVHPNYASNGWIYMAYNSLNNATKASQLNLARFKINDLKISELSVIFQTEASNTWFGHNGCRIDFDDQNYLYISVGEGGVGSYGGSNSPNKNAQTLENAWGKIHRITDNGGIPSDNPIFAGKSQPSSIYSYGHRNPQGLIFNPKTKKIWSSEHGPKGGDELNLVQKGQNYGWPNVSYGVNYDGVIISASPFKAGITPPKYQWTPSVGVCALAFITSSKFKAWKGQLLAGSLAYQYLSRLEIQGDSVMKEHKMLTSIGRVRNVKQAPDGSIYMSVEGPGRIVQMIAE